MVSLNDIRERAKSLVLGTIESLRRKLAEINWNEAAASDRSEVSRDTVPGKLDKRI